MNGKIALAGGGSAADSCLLDALFAQWIGSQGQMLYLPLAMRGLIPYDDGFAWIQTTFASFSVDKITMWTDLTGHTGEELGDFAGVYIGGGNTYSLLAQLLESGFAQHLVDYVQGGGAIYGGSAGAVILGKDLRTITHLDRNEIGLVETQCLNLAADHAIWVHYMPQDDALITDFRQQTGQPVFAISERSGIVIEKGAWRTVGFETAYQFNESGKRAIVFSHPNSPIP
ncbi:MAG: Type 1 glutamine amidotransferase-like domain-containing protein [Caldilineaceae bacterium]